MRSKKKSVEHSPILRIIEGVGNAKKTKSGNIIGVLDEYMDPKRMTNSLVPNWPAIHERMVSQLKLNLPDKSIADVILDKVTKGMDIRGNINKTIILIDARGDVYLPGDKEKRCNFLPTSDRMKILKMLDYSFMPTETIKANTFSVSVDSTNTSIQAINRKLRGALRLNNKQKVIDGQKIIGHRIDPKYEIKFIEN